MEWMDSLHIPHIGWKVRGVSLNASDEVSFYSSLLSTLDIAVAILRTQPYRCPDPVWPGEDHAAWQDLLFADYRKAPSPTPMAPDCLPHLRARLAKPCHRPTCLTDYVMYAPKANRHHVAWKVRSQWTREATRPEGSRERAPRRSSTEVITELTVRGAQPIWTPAA